MELPRLQVIICVIFVSMLITLTTAGVPLQRFESLINQQSEDWGLYNASDKVVKLTETNFNESILEQNRSSLVEFYNTYCGHCRRFAPIYKELAQQLYPWRDVLLVSAIDCASEENNALCRQYEVMGYPTLRYFGPGFHPINMQYGINIESKTVDGIPKALAAHLIAENRTANNAYWPNFQVLTENESAVPTLFDGLNNQRQYVVLVYEPENSTIAIETALYLLPWPAVVTRRVNDLSVAAKFQIDARRHKLAIVDRKGKIVTYEPSGDTGLAYAETIEKFLRNEHVTQRPDTTQRSTTPKSNTEFGLHPSNAENEKIVQEVQKNKHYVYQADLEMAMRAVLFNEIPKVNNISGERLLALQRFMTVLKRYNPLGAKGRNLVSKLNDYVVQFNQQLSGREFEEELQRLERNSAPIFSANHFIGCTGTRPGLRGFTCSLWQLFHFMTVQASLNDDAHDPLEVLQAMHGYVKYFFGCTECSEHFQAMATRRKIWSVPNKDESILWLWSAHNEVNQRLAGDSTEDPAFPKIQFPNRLSCSECYKQPIVSPANLETNWNKDAVLSFLKSIHHIENVSRYGVQREELLRTTLEKIRQKRQIANIFTDIDMRVGMLLYGFCIVMMVLAFKMFVFKGYRKKPYGHDILGKV